MGSRSRTGHVSKNIHNFPIALAGQLKRAIKRRQKKLHAIKMRIAMMLRNRDA